ncbi:hypothetical protein B0T17DRAFT_484201, partial [Bombardia bombarda]
PPDFTNRTIFPSFASCPEVAGPDPSSSSSVSSALPTDWYLLAQVKDDMTINKPTLVLGDRDDSPFALVFNGLERDGVDFKARGLKKGATAVIPRAKRTPPRDETKRGFVSVEREHAGEVRGIPGPLKRVLEVGEGLRAWSNGGEGGEVCESCWEERGEGGGLLKCMGCGVVRYCSKVSFLDGPTCGCGDCQVKGWNAGHKTDCKIIKAIQAVWE